MILFTICDLFTMNLYDGNGRKTPKYIQMKTKEKFPVWLPSHPPIYENGGQLFSDVRKHQKQAGVFFSKSSTLLGTIYAS